MMSGADKKISTIQIIWLRRLWFCPNGADQHALESALKTNLQGALKERVVRAPSTLRCGETKSRKPIKHQGGLCAGSISFDSFGFGFEPEKDLSNPCHKAPYYLSIP